MEMHDSKPRTRSGRWLPAALVALTVVPVIAGSARLAGLASDAPVTRENARFVGDPVPIAIHVAAASLFGVLGAFQFSVDLRRRRPRWHRLAGRVLVVAGLAAAASGLWMTLFYPRADGDGLLLDGLRLLFGSAMLGSIVLGVEAIRQRDFAAHGRWMIRGYAIGMGAGTQVLTHIPWLIVSEKPDVLTRALLLGAGWVINALVAEWIVRGRPNVITATTAAWRTACETLLRTSTGSRSPRAERPR